MLPDNPIALAESGAVLSLNANSLCSKHTSHVNIKYIRKEKRKARNMNCPKYQGMFAFSSIESKVQEAVMEKMRQSRMHQSDFLLTTRMRFH